MRLIDVYKILIKNKLLCIIGTFLVLLIPNFLPYHLVPLASNSIDKKEKFNKEFSTHIHSINDLMLTAETLTIVNSQSSKSIDYWDNVANVIQNIFYHGYSHYSLGENWIAAIMGKLFYRDLSAIVAPEDIIHYKMAACSQQSIVLMACLKRKGIDYRPVYFAHHYALEAYIENSWRFFDVNMEPRFINNTRMLSFAQCKKHGYLNYMYGIKMSPETIYNTFKEVSYGEINVLPASHALLFHKVTYILSRTLWLIPFMRLILYCRLRISIRSKKLAIIISKK